jgi:thiamine-monophosphate kinase
MGEENMRRAVNQTGEDEIIARYFRPLAKHPAAYGLIDDCAALTPPAGSDLVLKTDAIIGGVHFFPDDPADKVAQKALRVNLSDLAAKGAKPEGFLLALALPKEVDRNWLKAFARGLGKDAEAFGCPLLGGDTDRTPGPVTIAITVFGTLPRGSMVLRSGANVDDRVMVTGTIGDAVLGLALRQESAAVDRWAALTRRELAHLSERYLVPQPRNAIAEALRQHASAAMDVSDGLVGDFTKLCAASGVSADIDAMRVPLSSGAHRVVAEEPALLDRMLTGGDDYVIVCTVPPKKVASFQAAVAKAGAPIAEIGVVTKGSAAPRFLDGSGKPLRFRQLSFSHF